MGNRAVLDDFRTTRNPTSSYLDTFAGVFPYVIDVPMPLAVAITVTLTVERGGHAVTSEPWNSERRVYFSEFSRSFVEAELEHWKVSQMKRRHDE